MAPRDRPLAELGETPGLPLPRAGGEGMVKANGRCLVGKDTKNQDPAAGALGERETPPVPHTHPGKG